jgi:uncharacterized protein (TIGR00255 family)
MTGYGRGTAAAATKQITVEVRSLNGKQLDLGVKLPPALRPAEYELRRLASATVVRGKCDIYVSVEDTAAAGASRLDASLFAEYHRQISEAAKDAGLRLDDGAALAAAIVRLPEVMSSEAREATEEESTATVRALEVALSAFDAFRAQEGAVLLADMLARVGTIGELMTQVEPFERARVPAVRARILDNIAAMGLTVDNNRLEQEIVFWVEKLDITEEKVRLAKHCDYFRETAGEEGAGRKLGFIAQEMGREINTLGSKANDATIQQLVVRMKDELEKIKEQLLNIL